MNEIVILERATCRQGNYKDGLINLISDLPTSLQIMVEIGSYQGESSILFAENLKKLEKLYCVDPWVNGYSRGDVCSDGYKMEIVERNFDLRTLSYSQIIKNKTTSLEFSKLIEDHSLDFVYIDGDHSFESCSQDINLWLPKIKKGGVIAGHDYLQSHFPGVVKSVNNFFGSPDKTYSDTSWIKFL